MVEKRALLADIDRTLIDTTGLIEGAAFYTIETLLQRKLTKAEVTKIHGPVSRKFYQTLTGLEDVEDFERVHIDWQNNNLNIATIYPGVMRMLEELGNHRVLLAAVTSRTTNCLPLLQQIGIAHFFDAIVTGDDVLEHKPNPAPIYKALEIIEASPSQAFMMGDHRHDIEAGRAAGTKTIGVTWGFEGADIRNFQPDFVIEYIDEVLPILLR